MKTPGINLRYAALAFAVVLAAALGMTACTHQKAVDNSVLYWRQTSKSVIETNDLARVETTVPFKVITPVYLPAPTDLSTPDITLTYDDYGRISLLIQYFDLKNFRKIVVEQRPLTDSDNFYQSGRLSGFNTITIGGLDVLVVKLPDQTYNSRPLNGYKYGWPMGGVQCWVQLRGYTQEEDRAIIQSMIDSSTESTSP